MVGGHRDEVFIEYRKKKQDLYDSRHISKRKLADKDLQVRFDPKDHREFLTGFRKRKQQRRLVAQQQLQKKQKSERSEERSKKKTELREKLGLAEDYGVESSTDDEKSVKMKPSSVKVYEGAEFTTVATIEEMHHLESSEEEEEEDEEGADGGRGGKKKTAVPPSRGGSKFSGSKKTHEDSNGRSGSHNEKGSFRAPRGRRTGGAPQGKRGRGGSSLGAKGKRMKA